MLEVPQHSEPPAAHPIRQLRTNSTVGHNNLVRLNSPSSGGAVGELDKDLADDTALGGTLLSAGTTLVEPPPLKELEEEELDDPGAEENMPTIDDCFMAGESLTKLTGPVAPRIAN